MSTDHLVELGYVDPLEAKRTRAELQRRHASALACAEAYLAEGRPDDAIGILVQLQSAAPHWTAPRRLMAHAEHHKGRCAAALENLNWLEEHGLEQAELAVLRGAVELQQRHLDEALACAEYGRALSMPNPAADVLSGQVLLRRGFLGAAEAMFESALTCEPQRHDALAGMAAVALCRGDWERAADWALQALDVDMSRAPVHLRLGIALAALEKFPEAMTALQTAAAMAPRLAAPHRWLAKAAQRAGDKLAAEQHAERGREIIRTRRTAGRS